MDALIRNAEPSHRVYETASPEAASDFINRTYIPHRPRPFRRDGFRFRAETTIVGDLERDTLLHTSRTSAHNGGVSCFAAVIVRSGELEITEGREYLQLRTGDVMLHRLNREFESLWTRLDIEFITFPFAHVVDVAERAGVPEKDFRVEAMTPMSDSLREHWIDTVGWVTRTIDSTPSALSNKILLVQTIRTLSAAALAVFPNTTMTQAYVGGAGRSTPRSVRRAMQFMDEHAREPISAADVAAASGLGVRALQEAFRTHRDQTPMTYLRIARLAGARSDLRAANPLSDSVAAIASRWGFAHGGHFAALYHELYGQLPGTTLRE